MQSWRDSASTQAQQDLDELLNAVLPFAQEQLTKRRAFFPFGALVTPSGEVRLSTAHSGGGRVPDPQAMLNELLAAARAEPDSQRAVAFAADVKLGRDDAVRIELEHAEGVAIVVTVPYVLSRQRPLRFGRPAAGPGQARVW